MTALLLVLAVLVIASLPTWPYARGFTYGYWPSGGLGLVFILLLILILTHRI